MSAREQDPVHSLAERIANRLTRESQPETPPPAARDAANSRDELAALRATVSEMRQRLTQIESRVSDTRPSPNHADDVRRQQPSQIQSPQSERPSPPTNGMPSHWLSGTYIPAVHPSEERFGIGEAVSELVEFFEREKVCNVEPGEKPCDHCGMCSARGF